jgi:hypothetical protein
LKDIKQPWQSRRNPAFTNSKNSPADLAELTIDFSVSLTIVTDLANPILPVGFGQSEVLRASVPEARIDEDSDSESRKGEVRPSWEFLPVTDESTNSSAHHRGAEPQLKFGSLAPNQ